MSDATPRLGLDYVLANQAQKHVTVNGGLWRLDALVQMRAESRMTSAPPGDAADGDCWIIPDDGATGGWAALEPGAVVRKDGAVWEPVPAPVGAVVWVADEATPVVLTEDGWRPLGETLDSVGPLSRLGVGAEPEDDTPLVVAGPASRFDHDADGDHRIVVNRAAAADTASILFQTAYAGEAEIGLCGTAGLSLRTSPDGATWKTLLSADPGGRLGLNTASPQAVLHLLSEATAVPAVLMAAYNATNAGCSLSGLKARGSAASPAAILSGDRLLALYGKGWTTAGVAGGNAAGLQFLAAEDYTATAQGSSITFETTPIGSTSRRAVVSYQPNGALRLMPLTSAPATPAAGEIYFDQTLGAFRGWTGSAWTVMG